MWVITERCIASGCTLLFYETYGKKLSGEREPSPRYALLVNDGIVQPVPEHPKREHVFCVSNSHGDVYLFQVRGPIVSFQTAAVCVLLLFLWFQLGFEC